MKATAGSRRTRRAWKRPARMLPRVRTEPERTGELVHISEILPGVLARIDASRRERTP